MVEITGSDPSSFRKKFFMPKPIPKEEVKYAADNLRVLLLLSFAKYTRCYRLDAEFDEFGLSELKNKCFSFSLRMSCHKFLQLKLFVSALHNSTSSERFNVGKVTILSFTSNIVLTCFCIL